jgi:hemerythrin-like metal-binding protein
MISFDWNSNYSVGVKDLDKQHQDIMVGLNELHEEMMNGKVNEAVAPLINHLVSLAGEHFAFEEKLMESTQFPGLADHRAYHQALSRKVGEFIARHDMGDRAAYCQFMYVLRDSMTKHMETLDQEYVPWLAEHNIN